MDGHDDARLAAAFRAAADEPPPAGFGHADVLAASRRAAVRRRSMVAAGALVVLAVSGVGVAAALPAVTGGADTASTAAAPMEDRESAPSEAARGAAPELGPPLGPADQTECINRQDPALRALVEEALPETAGAPAAPITLECRPGGDRGVTLEIDDAGLLTVSYVPPGEELPAVGDDPSSSAPTASGGMVVLTSRATEAGAPAPLGDRLAGAAEYLAPRL